MGGKNARNARLGKQKEMPGEERKEKKPTGGEY